MNVIKINGVCSIGVMLPSIFFSLACYSCRFSYFPFCLVLSLLFSPTCYLVLLAFSYVPCLFAIARDARRLNSQDAPPPLLYHGDGGVKSPRPEQQLAAAGKAE